MSLINTKNLGKTYFNEGVATNALHDVSFSIDEGKFVAIMGASGSGKSTLLHILGFLDRHTDGEYRFDGKTIDEHSEENIAHVRNKEMGFVFQTFNLLARTTVLENVKLPLLYSRVPESLWNERALSVIKSVGLSHRLDHESSQLSGGEKQRVAIARALINRPRIIFADEPTGNLDSKSGEMVMDTLQKLNQDGHTILLITHETYTAEHAERIIKIHDGEIISDDLVKNRRTTNHFIK
ncbi:MAG: ABC transporter ATP-binding protein [Patescibacteria group bacterium]